MPNSPDVPITLVAIDEDEASLRLVEEALHQEDLDIVVSADAEKGLDLVLQMRPQIVLLDLTMPKLSGMELLARISVVLPETAVILLAPRYSTESAVKAVKEGARDYINKPVRPSRLRERIDQLVEEVRTSRRATEVEHELVELTSFQGIIGRSPKMQEVFEQIRRIAPHFRSVLLNGETGTGKELVARALHDLSPASAGPFVACNCSAVAETLFESELFGYVRGAFTGAQQDKLGLLEYAHGGTLLLDEVGDMPLGLQSKLLRVLENQEILRVGSPIPQKIDVRVVAASNRNLRTMVAAREFRQDLFYRLSMVEVRLPRLAERKEDLALLERHFLHRFSEEFKKPVRRLTLRAEALLGAYSWPGNVRELENVLGHACMMSAGEFIDLGDFPNYIFEGSAAPDPDWKEIMPLNEFERSYVRRVLVSLDGNKVRTAEALGISRSKLYSLLVEEDREKK